MYTYKYPHPAVTADCIVFAYEGDQLQVLLIERAHDPCQGMWAFPGGFMNIDETAEACARRELEEETGLEVGALHQVGAFTTVDRDPRERVISIAFCTIAEKDEVQGGDDAAKARWWPVESLPPLAFDHEEMLRQAQEVFNREIQA